ncbi:hypothetical protein ACTQX5_03270 [Faecalicoccus sp. LCP19S3_E3]|uniref:hypothetical protein n=1 Tax=unclassified Faecalicoccus TaxID=2643311 RepID=UPI003F930DF7
MNKKTRNIVIGSGVGIAVLIGIFGLTQFNQAKLHVQSKEKVIELGDTVSLSAKEFLKKDTPKKVLKEVSVKSDLKTDSEKYTYDKEKETVTSKDKDFLDVGKYEVELSLDKEKETVNLEVKDTSPPKFKDFKEEIKIEQNAENVKLEDYFKADDLSETTIKVEDKGLDVSKVGSYEINVIATDKYDNKEEKESKVTVVSTEEAKEKIEELTKPEKGETPMSKKTKETKEVKQQEVQKQQASTNNTGNGNSGNTTQPTQPSTPVNNNTGNGNSGSTTQPIQPSKPLDDTIPAGAFRTEAEATAYGESMISGWDSKYDRYSVLGQTTEAGTWYYIVSLYQ